MKLESLDIKYLLSRGYTVDLLKKERLFSIQKGNHKLNSLEVYVPIDSICQPLKSGTGKLYGIHTLSRIEKCYQTFYIKERGYFPPIYGDILDYNILYNTGEVILVEGLFDRIIFKRLFPNRACFSKLNKNISSKLIIFLERYAKKIYIAYDNDEAGNAVEKKFKKILKEIDLYRILPLYKDPNETWLKLGDKNTFNYFEQQLFFSL